MVFAVKIWRVIAIAVAVVTDALLLIFAIFFVAGAGSVLAWFVTIATIGLVVLNLRLFFPWPLDAHQVARTRLPAEVMSAVAVVVGLSGLGLSVVGWFPATERRDEVVLLLVAGVANLLATRAQASSDRLLR